jgi:TonB family protein
MKKRATKKVDISGPMRQADIRGTVVVDVLVGPDGSVVCAQDIHGHPMLLREVEEALRSWRFKPLIQDNAPVAYVGQIDFMLCNINCGKQGPAMTLLK